MRIRLFYVQNREMTHRFTICVYTHTHCMSAQHAVQQICLQQFTVLICVLQDTVQDINYTQPAVTNVLEL